MDFSLTLRVLVAIITLVVVRRHCIVNPILPPLLDNPCSNSQDIENQWPTDNLDYYDSFDDDDDELHED
ncbi:uncharacterized protein L3040_006814 [Drepanopeziza brunnea f. sp. 'multigermtubi']|uniref:uncharacterized protein n=1 Tax=Drepanopeziza brunnea f. sp. 'multigermtubi' TaxID=698441 RepID=UPI00239A8BBA|nr:hypothetical protein L3040_006814 [Drepanopeziza brunnea f. sp. 'multigermtubi']